MKLNRKGYMLVEIVIASVLAMGIAYYLLNLTYKFKNTDADVQESYYYLKDKILITNNIMNDLRRGDVSGVVKFQEDSIIGVDFELFVDGHFEKRRLQIDKLDSDYNVTSIKYGKLIEIDGIVSFDTDDISYYEKKLEKTLVVGEPVINIVQDKAFSIKIPITSWYTDNNYDIILFSSSYKGVVLLSSVEPGSYVDYRGNNDCPSEHCDGTNANYESDAMMGYCVDSEHDFAVNGWRVAYINANTAYLISAGAPECMCTNSDGSTGDNFCSSYSVGEEDMHIINLNARALKYCNVEYAYNGQCNSDSAWAMDNSDFWIIAGRRSSSVFEKCINISNTSCGLNNNLIDNGGNYWFAYTKKNISSDYYGSQHIDYTNYMWEDKKVQEYGTWWYREYSALGVRPVLRLSTDVFVVGGTGTYDDPYRISNFS